MVIVKEIATYNIHYHFPHENIIFSAIANQNFLTIPPPPLNNTRHKINKEEKKDAHKKS
jgi:hypothetical protein